MRRSVAPRPEQLSFLDSAAEREEVQRRAEDAWALDADCALFEERQTGILRKKLVTAASQVAQIKAMVRASTYGTARALLASRDALYDAITAGGKASADLRSKRRRAWQDFVHLLAPELGPDLVRCANEVLKPGHYFGRRTKKRADLVDIDLGDSSKAPRNRTPFLWNDSDRLVAAAEGLGLPALQLLRLIALILLHTRTSLTPGQVLKLTWEQVIPLFESTGEFLELPLTIRHSQITYLIHREAIEAAKGLWVAVGRPETGAVLTKVRGAPKDISWQRAYALLRAVSQKAGFGSLDRRWLRVPFARWLENEGIAPLIVARAFGFREMKDYERFRGPVDEMVAQIRRTEVLDLAASSSRPIHEVAAFPTSPIPRHGSLTLAKGSEAEPAHPGEHRHDRRRRPGASGSPNPKREPRRD